MIQDRPVHGVIRIRTRPACPDRRGPSRRPLDGRKLFVAAASLAVLLMPAHSVAQPDVPVESQLSQGVGAVHVPLAGSTGTLTTQILQSIRHWQEAPRIVVDTITESATASAPAVRQNQPVLTAPVALSVEEIIRDVWPDQLEDRAVRIAWRESRFVPTARNACCFGIFQVFFSVHRRWLADFGVYQPSDLYDPRVNATVALALYEAAGWSPWSQG